MPRSKTVACLLNMLERLQKKWKVSGARLVLILLTFAVGGSLTGYAGRKLIGLFDIDQKWLWIIVYIILITLLWPVAVLLISVFTGQFSFFVKYLRKVGIRMKLLKNKVETRHALSPQLAIFASGAGSNAQKIIDHFRNNPSVRVRLIA